MSGDALVWITGASSGIGRALADSVPWPGAEIMDVSRSGAEGLIHVAADLSDPSSWAEVGRSMAESVGSFAGERVVLIHCAATLDPMVFARDANPDEYTRAVLLNSAAPQVLGQAFVHAVRDRDVKADLVILTSGASRTVYEGWSLYGPAKAAVDHWVRHVGEEELRRGSRCRVLAVAPGVVATPMQAQIRATSEEDFPAGDRFRGLHERGELRDPADAARDVWTVVLDATVPSGSVIDVRTMNR